MAAHIPFVNSKIDCDLLKKYYADSEVIRLSLWSAESILTHLPQKPHLWIDSAVDGYHQLLTEKRKWDDFKDFLSSFEENEILSKKRFIQKPDKNRLDVFVNSILNRANQFKPEWISVPQLPIVDDASRNLINKLLASSSAKWKSENKFSGKFILPLIFTHQKQLKGKVQWKAKLRTAKVCYENSEANGVWAVDSSLCDQKGSQKFGERFSRLIDFHRDLNDTFPNECIKIGGPYWGMNLILWARELCDYPAICLGNAYQYYISGGFIYPGKARLPIPPLRRWAVASPQLKEWLVNSLVKISKSDPTRKELLFLEKRFQLLSQKEVAREQVSKFYKGWFDKINTYPPPGRALALYQDLSKAYVLGKQNNLPELPRDEAPGRAPERVAQQLMLQCL